MKNTGTVKKLFILLISLFVCSQACVVSVQAMDVKIIEGSDEKRAAYHESGHVVAHLHLQDLKPFSMVSIVPNATSLGRVTLDSKKNEPFGSTEEVESMLILLFGGLAAEEVLFGEVPEDAEKQSDFREAKYIAKKAVGDSPCCVDKVIRYHYDKAKELISANKPELTFLAKELLKRKALSAKEVYNLFGIPRPPGSYSDFSALKSDKEYLAHIASFLGARERACFVLAVRTIPYQEVTEKRKKPTGNDTWIQTLLRAYNGESSLVGTGIEAASGWFLKIGNWRIYAKLLSRLSKGIWRTRLFILYLLTITNSKEDSKRLKKASLDLASIHEKYIVDKFTVEVAKRYHFLGVNDDSAYIVLSDNGALVGDCESGSLEEAASRMPIVVAKSMGISPFFHLSNDETKSFRLGVCDGESDSLSPDSITSANKDSVIRKFGNNFLRRESDRSRRINNLIL